MVVTIVVIVGIIGIGVGILAYMNRTEKGIESGITSFRRELHALAPRPGEEPRSSTDRPVDEARGVTIMSGDDEDDDEDDNAADDGDGDNDDNDETDPEPDERPDA